MKTSDIKFEKDCTNLIFAKLFQDSIWLLSWKQRHEEILVFWRMHELSKIAHGMVKKETFSLTFNTEKTPYKEMHFNE